MQHQNQYSHLVSQKDTESLLRIAEDRNEPDEYRKAAIWEIEKRFASDQPLEEPEERLRARWQGMRSRLNEPDKYSTFWPRFLAAIIDGIVVGAVSFGLMTLIFSIQYDDSYEVLIQLLPHIYYIVFHARYGQTLGKMAMGIKVVQNDNESPITWKQAYMRDLVPILIIGLSLIIINMDDSGFDYMVIFYAQIAANWISAIWFWAEIITMLTNKKRRAVHDYIAGTVVIRTR